MTISPQRRAPRAWEQRGGMEDLKRWTDEMTAYVGDRRGPLNAVQTDQFGPGAVSPQAAAMISGGRFQVDASAARYAGISPFTVSIVDGQALSWGPFDATPDYAIVDGYKLPRQAATGDYYDLRLQGVGPSGATAYLKAVTGGVTLTTQTGSTRSVTNANPGQVEVQKPTSGDSHDGSYRFTCAGVLFGEETVIYTEFGSAVIFGGGLSVSLYYRTSFGGALTLAGSHFIAATSVGSAAFSEVVTFTGLPAIGQHADPEFRLVVESRYSAGSYMTDVTQVAYETAAGGSAASATPGNAPQLTLLVLPKTR